MANFLMFLITTGATIGLSLICFGIILFVVSFFVDSGKLLVSSVVLTFATMGVLIGFALLAAYDNAPSAWFRDLPAPEKVMMRKFIEKTHEPISVWRFHDLQRRYDLGVRAAMAKEQYEQQFADRLNRPAVVNQLKALRD